MLIFMGVYTYISGWWFQIFFFSPRSLGKWSNLTSIFFKWVETTNQNWCFLKWWYPQNTPKWSFLVGKPMVVVYHPLGNPHYIYIYTHIYVHCGFTQLALQMVFLPTSQGSPVPPLPRQLLARWGNSVDGIPMKTWYILSHRMRGTSVYCTYILPLKKSSKCR